MSESEQAAVFVQYKGTDICLDFHCICESEYPGSDFGHYDGYHAYALQCGRCGRIYEMPTNLTPKLVESTQYEPILIQETA